jgi:hypothetical protein
METILQEQTIKDVTALQQKLYLPLPMVREVPPMWLVEFRERPAGLIQLVFVDHKTPAFSKRYRVVRHHGSAWVSVPRTWLQHRNAKDGDTFVLFEEDGALYLRHQKEPACH